MKCALQIYVTRYTVVCSEIGMLAPARGGGGGVPGHARPENHE